MSIRSVWPALHHRVSAVLREPLCLFLLLGGLIFALDAWLNRPLDEARIEVQRSDLERLRAVAVKQWGREPDAAQLRQLVEEYIREEVLYREALASGLEQDDVIVRRRLAQKMEFLAQADVRLPEDDEVRAFYAANPQRYAAPVELGFRQLYFGADETALARAEAALAQLHDNPRQVPQSDRLPLPERFVAQAQPMIARDFGEDFAAQLFALPVGQWLGPLHSPHGLHLVRVERRQAAQPLAFAEVRERVATDLTALRQQQARDAAYQALRGRYQVEVAPIGTGVEVAAQ
jgi:hypothetical protein